MKNIYLPEQVKIINIEKLSPDAKLFKLERSAKFFSGKKLVFTPGQFALVGLMGYGESPFGFTSSPYEKSYFEIVVRNTGGRVTSALHDLKIGDSLTMRGPYGNGFPLDFFEGKDVVMATGGCGIPPIASLIEYIIKNREKFGRVYLLYGAKTPENILLKERMKKWEEKNIKTVLIVDTPATGWNGYVGFVPDLVSKIEIDARSAVVAMCGPGRMADALEKVLRPLGISDRRIFVSEERKMQCGVGKCQHCTFGEKYVCLNGPVFNFDEIDKAWD